MLKSFFRHRNLVLLPIWMAVSLLAAVFGTKCLLTIFVITTGIKLESINSALLSAVVAAIIYVLTLVIIIGVPALIRHKRTSRADLGLTRLPTWTDIFITPAGFVVYIICSAVLLLVMTKLFPSIDAKQAQDVGFSQLTGRAEFILAFLTLVVVAPVAEEILFRGYLFGKLKKTAPIWVAILITSVIFGAAHGAWNLAIDTFALSVILCILRQITGSVWAPILLHMSKNAIAFYLLFINPSILTTLIN